MELIKRRIIGAMLANFDPNNNFLRNFNPTYPFSEIL